MSTLHTKISKNTVNFDSEFIEKVKDFAFNAHANVNHLYGKKPYSYHLEMAVECIRPFLHHIPIEDQTDVICAMYLHDTIEDCRLTRNDIVKISNERIADIVYALTNEKGRNRAERANDKYYSDMIIVKYARFCKLGDRMANIQNSASESVRMYAVYSLECVGFLKKLFPNQKPFKKKNPNCIKRFINYIHYLLSNVIVIEQFEKEIVREIVQSLPYENNADLLQLNYRIQNSKY